MKEKLVNLLLASSQISYKQMVFALFICCIIAAYIFMVYRVVTKTVFYSKTFNITMAMMSVITTGIILGMQSSLVISLGMVGALSIVRFRTAIKDPMDLLYLFWAITSGITAGAGMYALTLLTAVIIILMITLFYHKQQNGRIYIAVIHYQGTQAGDEIIRCFGKRKYFVKSKTMRNEKTEMAVEIYCRQNDMEFMEKIRDIGGVEDVTLIQYNGEYHG